MSTTEQVRSALDAVAKAPVPADDDASLFDAGVIDSFGLMEFVAELERRFGVKVPDEELTPRRFETVAKAAAWFDARKPG
jgi:acyl carrier protein